MRTRPRMVRVRRRRPSGVVWAISLMLITLVIYLLTSEPRVQEALSVQSSPTPEVEVRAERVTQEIRFDDLAYYLIQFGAYTDAENARVEAARYVKRGAAGYVYFVDSVYHVIGAGYDTQTEAERVMNKLLEQEQMNCVVYPVRAEPVELRVTATQAQIDALVSAQQAARNTVSAMNALAFRLDGGGVALNAASTELSTLLANITGANAALKRLSGDTPNAVAAGLIDLMEKIEESLTQLTTTVPESVLSFSSKIKYNTIDLRIKHAEYLIMLSSM